MRNPDLLALSAFDAASFTVTWDGAEFVFSTFESDIRDGNPFGRIYADACDVGFVLRTAKGNEVTVYLDSEIKNGDEIGGWVFRPTPESLRKVPAAKSLKVVVFND